MLRHADFLRIAALLAIPVFASCDASAPGQPPSLRTESMFVVPASLDELAGPRFFDHPFPSDLRRQEDGSARFSGWPNPSRSVLVERYVESTAGLLDGFSPSAPVYLRFTNPLDPSSLPTTPPDALAPDSPVQMIDVDPRSPERGRRRLVRVMWKETANDGSHWQPNTLAVMPMIGRPLRPATRYAVLATNKLRAKGGGPVTPSAELDEVLGKSPATSRTARAKEIFAPALEELRAAGIDSRDLVHLSVFTTNDPTSELFAIADDVRANVTAPTARDWREAERTDDYDVYEGTYGPSPNYQAGSPPYRTPSDGGAFLFDRGRPVVQGTFDARFAIAVPRDGACPSPSAGYPVVLYAHGTGGDYRSFLRDGTARELATRCLASMGVDQIFHGTRPGAPAPNDPLGESIQQLLFFNFDNTMAARTNNRQSSIDVVQQARLFTDVRTAIPVNVSRTSKEISFDGTRVLFFGHSQGGLNGPLFLAASDLARGGVLSGAGSMLTVALLAKTSPIDVSSFVRTLLGLAGEEHADELDAFHPAFTLAQSIVDVTDPVHYGGFITTHPRPGFAPKSIFQTEGIASDGTGDTYAPPPGIEALAVSMRLPRIAPGVRAIVESTWAGVDDVTIPTYGLHGNLANGGATGALAQFSPLPGRDGHFVVFDLPAARAQAATFCRDLADNPVGRLAP